MNSEENSLPPPGEMNGPFKMSFSWRAQLGAALFILGREGVAGVSTRVHLWGRPYTVADPAYTWTPDQWYQFAVKVVLLSLSGSGPRSGNLPIEPTSIATALLEAFGPNPPDATFHLPQRSHRLLELESGWRS